MTPSAPSFSNQAFSTPPRDGFACPGEERVIRSPKLDLWLRQRPQHPFPEQSSFLPIQFLHSDLPSATCPPLSHETQGEISELKYPRGVWGADSPPGVRGWFLGPARQTDRGRDQVTITTLFSLWPGRFPSLQNEKRETSAEGVLSSFICFSSFRTKIGVFCHEFQRLTRYTCGR